MVSKVDQLSTAEVSKKKSQLLQLSRIGFWYEVDKCGRGEELVALGG
jgi:hypothetical protein